MLVLTRRIGQEIIIGDDIRITLLEVRGQQVRVGISAPPAIRVDREEVLARRREEAKLNGRSPALTTPACCLATQEQV